MSRLHDTLGARPAAALLDGLADALEWPRAKAARILSGSAADRVGAAVICGSDSVLGEQHDPAAAVLLVTPSLQRRGRRSYDTLVMRASAAPAGDDAQAAGADATGAGGARGFRLADWERTDKLVIETSAMLVGGAGGIEALLAEDLGASSVAPLVPVDRDDVKFAGYVPQEALKRVRSAVFAAGAGRIGDYTECSWSTLGTGTFRGGESTNPTVGSAGSFEEAAEVRFETVCPRHLRHAVGRAYVRAHPYEEPAYEFLSLATPAMVGAGRVMSVDRSVASALTWLREADMLVEHVPGSHNPGRSPAQQVAITLSAISPLLTELLREGDVALVVCAEATAGERQLLHERGVDVAVVDVPAVIKHYGPPLAARLSRMLGLPVTFSAGLEFPQHHGTDGRANGQGEAGEAAGVQPPADAAPAQLWFDGGSRGNPGPAAAAYVLYDADGNELYRSGIALGSATNNVAEYNGLVEGLRAAVDMGARELEIFSDSELVVRQIEGRYKVKHPAMKPLYERARALLGKLDHFSIHHVLRAKNAVADGLVNETLDEL